MRLSILSFGASCSIAVLVLSAPAVAQTNLRSGDVVLDAPVAQTVDGNGVDLLTGLLTVTTPALSSGSGDSKTSFYFSWTGRQWQPNTPTASLDTDNWHMYVSSGSGTDEFEPDFAESTYIWQYKQVTPNTGAYLRCVFAAPISGQSWPFSCQHESREGVYTPFTSFPAVGGQFVTAYQHYNRAFSNVWLAPQFSTQAGLKTLYNNAGEASSIVHVRYPNGYSVKSVGSYWHRSVSFELRSCESCNNAALQTIQVYTPNLKVNTDLNPSSPYYLNPKNTTQTWTDVSGNVFSYRFDGSGNIINITTSLGVQSSFTYDGDRRVKTVTRGGRVWNYSYDFGGSSKGAGTTTATAPDGGVTKVSHARKPGPPTAIVDPLGRATTYSYDGFQRITAVYYPEGNSLTFEYDSFGNMITRTTYPKPLSTGGEPVLIERAAYGAQCLRGPMCHKPTSVTDAKDQVTTFAYDVNGRVTLQESADVGGERARTTYTYANQPIFYLDASGAITQHADQLIVLKTKSECLTGLNCAGTDRELVTEYAYASAFSSGSGANNGFPIAVSRKLGSGTLLDTSSISYDQIGNATAVDGPQPGTQDVTYSIYDVAQRKVREVRPDPDGVGALPRPMTSWISDSDGREREVQTGYGQAVNGSDFTLVRSVRTTYEPTTGLKSKVEEVTP